jgi:dTDP-glucose 4,6-dehydratase
MRVLITGGAGFIGSNYVRMIADGRLSGYSEVTVLDKLTYAGVMSNLEQARKIQGYRFIHGDICDVSLVRSLVSNVDHIINFAAQSHVDRSITASDEFINSNIVGVQVILDAIKFERNPVRFLQVSTDEVYGSVSEGSWDEESPLLPNSPYSASKAGAELLIMAYFRTFGLDLVVTRCSNNYGTHHFPEKLIPLFITNILEEKKVPLYGNGKNIRDWLHVDDHCRAIHAVLTKGQTGNIYNIGGGEELSNIQVTKMIINLMGKSESCIEYVEDRKGHDFRYSVDWKKIKNELEYKPLVKFEIGLQETIDWYASNADWWKPLKMQL